MKIVMTRAGSALSISGINTFIFELSKALIRAGHEVFVVSEYETQKIRMSSEEMFDQHKRPKIMTFEIVMKPIYGREHARKTFQWLYIGSLLLKEIKPDMIIANGALPTCSSALKVILCHDLEFRFGYKQILYDMLVYQTFDIVAATSSELTKEVSRKLRIASKPMVTLPVCVDTKRYFCIPQEQREHAILHVGTWADKNLTSTLNAFCILARMDSRIKLYIVGNLWKKHIDMLSKVKKEFAKRIVCVGDISKIDLLNLYSRVKVTLVPSIYTVPVLSPTVLESLASGTPVVGSSTSISQDLLVDGCNGFRVHPANFTDLSERTSMLTTDQDLWRRMSEDGLRVAKRFDSSIVAKKYINLHGSRFK